MSRFCFCNCPAGFSAEPERHAPDCPGRSGAGKARTPVPATTPALKVTAAEELDAVLHWRGKHAIAVREREGLQVSLNTADQTIDDLSAAVSRRTKRVRDLEAQLAYAVDALNEVAKASAMYEKPFEIATLAIGEMSAMAEQPAPVAVDETAEFSKWTHEVIAESRIGGVTLKVQRMQHLTPSEEKSAHDAWMARAALNAKSR